MSSANRRETSASSAYWLQRWLRQYGFALVIVAAAGLMRYGLLVALGSSQPFISFYPAIMLIALLGGLGPGVFATLFSAAVAEYFFMAPLNSFVLKNPRDVADWPCSSLWGWRSAGWANCFGDADRGWRSSKRPWKVWKR